MNHRIIKKIVEDVFEKAKNDSPLHSINALTNFVEEHSRLSYKTLERAHKKYIENEKTTWSPNGASINNFCNFLGYSDYRDYVEKNEKYSNKIDEINPNPHKEKTSTMPPSKKINFEPRARKNRWAIKFIMAIGIALLLYQFIRTNWNSLGNRDVAPKQCMAWAQDHYEKVDCNLSLHTIYGTKAEKLVPEKMETMKKVEVDASTTFFSEETGRPLIWYYKNKDADVEYFTSPGLHPIHGETLKKITHGIIQKYVPIHKMNKNSFIKIKDNSEGSN